MATLSLNHFFSFTKLRANTFSVQQTSTWDVITIYFYINAWIYHTIRTECLHNENKCPTYSWLLWNTHSFSAWLMIHFCQNTSYDHSLSTDKAPSQKYILKVEAINLGKSQLPQNAFPSISIHLRVAKFFISHNITHSFMSFVFFTLVHMESYS